MNIIFKEPYENGGYSNMQTWEVSDPIPETHALWPDTLDTADYYNYNGFVVLTIETIDGVDTVTAYEPNVEAWEAWKASLPEPEPPEPQISDDEAVAIITDTLTDSAALNIITGGNEE